ncbi:MAG: hypothetical protein ACSHW7_14270 [Patiriisocius sp.]|uniref:hypothetical protein n=1 Tax=Patiriisocius sp. TaxID=2822396 RepID=UPI003EF34D44
MNKSILILILTFITLSCRNTENSKNEQAKILNLRAENDSLKKILAEINNKYVFDSISMRDIPSYKNSYELNSMVKGEIVFIGYNQSGKYSQIIMGDSVDVKSNPIKIFNPDTLKMRNGGYNYEFKLEQKEKIWRANFEIKHKYGAKFQGLISNKVKAKKTNGNNVYNK